MVKPLCKMTLSCVIFPQMYRKSLLYCSLTNPPQTGRPCKTSGSMYCTGIITKLKPDFSRLRQIQFMTNGAVFNVISSVSRHFGPLLCMEGRLASIFTVAYVVLNHRVVLHYWKRNRKVTTAGFIAIVSALSTHSSVQRAVRYIFQLREIVVFFVHASGWPDTVST